jgi:regulatory protein
MKITSLSVQVRNPDRVNVSVDGKYRFSLDIAQVTDLGVKKGRELNEEELAELETEGQFGKLYARALEYSLMRPHSVREVRDYLWKKTQDRRGKEGRVIKGYSPSLTERVLQKLQQKSYVDDESFARWWIEGRNVVKGTSLRKLTMELRAKGVATEIIDRVMGQSERTDADELQKMITKKRARYTDDQKLMQYLARQGFDYESIKEALRSID